jgi:hypothetical protein
LGPLPKLAIYEKFGGITVISRKRSVVSRQYNLRGQSKSSDTDAFIQAL